MRIEDQISGHLLENQNFPGGKWERCYDMVAWEWVPYTKTTQEFLDIENRLKFLSHFIDQEKYKAESIKYDGMQFKDIFKGWEK